MSSAGALAPREDLTIACASRVAVEVYSSAICSDLRPSWHLRLPTPPFAARYLVEILALPVDDDDNRERIDFEGVESLRPQIVVGHDTGRRNPLGEQRAETTDRR